MIHLTDDQLVQWRDRPTDEARAVVVAHLAVCGDCAARYATLVRDAPVSAAPARFNPAEFRARGIDARARQTPRRNAVGWSLAALAAAAVVVLAVFVGGQRGATDTSVTRGGETLEVVSPRGDVTDASEFVWTAPAGAERFRLEISDPGSGLVYETEVRGVRATLPADVRARLRAGIEYRWAVSRLGPRGETLESSPLAAFRLTR